MVSDSDPGATRVISCHRLGSSSRGALRWAVTLCPASGQAYAVVLYYDPYRRRWGMSRSERFSERARRQAKQVFSEVLTPDFGAIPAGEKLSAIALSKLLPPRAHAEVAASAMKRSRR